MPPGRCQVIGSAELLGKKWVFAVLDGVFFEPGTGFTPLQKKLKKISAKVLSQRLKELQKHGLMEKKTQNTPNGNKKTSHYFLTKKGRGLHRALTALKKWGIEWSLVPKNCGQTNCAGCAISSEKKSVN
ncbi:MAG: helix-turn-helix domain-containing protein [Candidatus Micrarchaeota archaeon]